MTAAQKQRLMALSLSELKKEAWRVFSEWIRRRWANDLGMAVCCSCGRDFHWKQGDAGHWPSIAGRYNSILYDERGCHFQCKRCNIFLHGNPAGYDAYMLKHYGRKTMDRLIRQKAKTVVFSKQDLIRKIDGWVKKIGDLRSRTENGKL